MFKHVQFQNIRWLLSWPGIMLHVSKLYFRDTQSKFSFICYRFSAHKYTVVNVVENGSRKTVDRPLRGVLFCCAGNSILFCKRTAVSLLLFFFYWRSDPIFLNALFCSAVFIVQCCTRRQLRVERRACSTLLLLAIYAQFFCETTCC